MLGAMCKAVLGRQGLARMILKLNAATTNNLYAVLTHQKLELRFQVSYRSLGMLIGHEKYETHSPTLPYHRSHTTISDWLKRTVKNH